LCSRSPGGGFGFVFIKRKQLKIVIRSVAEQPEGKEKKGGGPAVKVISG
jgi:hypothetical protein